VIISILFLIVDLYVMAIYSHKDEPNTSLVNIFCKILIVLTLLQTQFQPFFLIVDVANSRTSNDDLTVFWLILYITLMINIAVLKPIATSLYERDHDDSCIKNTVWMIVEIAISVFLIGFIILMGWTFWGTIKIFVDSVKVDSAKYSVAASSVSLTEASAYFEFNSTIITFFIASFCILGYPILACCGACGLTVMPITLVLDFVNRPTFRKTVDAKKVSEFLKVETVRLLREH
jgi:LMBR1 domain-containing protein 1